MAVVNSFRANSTPLLEVRGIVKKYPGVLALDRVHFDVRRSEVHCLAGENGAGKSTLIEIIGGSYSKDEGIILIDGNEVEFSSPKHAQEMGIAVLHQDLPVLPFLSVAENIFLSRQPKTKLGFVNYSEMYKRARRWLDVIQADINPQTPLGNLSVAKQQLVSIAKALSLEARVIIFDEPSAVLTSVELERLFDIINSLKQEGRGITYISHRLEEIFEIGDRVTVLRNGRLVGTELIRKINKDTLIKMLVGREIVETTGEVITKDKGGKRETVLTVKGLNRSGVFKDIDFKVDRGEILGIYGLVGSGRTELVRSIIGADPLDEGEIYLYDQKVKISSPKDAIKLGICLAPEDRKRQGLFLGKSVQENITLPSLKKLKKAGFLNYKKIADYASVFVKKMKIVTPGLNQKVRFLSGGNQQKVVLAKWLGMNLKVFFFDEPTRGIDVGAKEEIRNLIRKLAHQGKSIIVISSEIPEILRLSDRIVVMYSGRITKELSRDEANKEKLIAYSMGVTQL